ncbi:NAD-dependent epimerase/dehydratase family protein [Candidatus Dojkabacteria bacterium]|nr:NAD-dependent epimerase/dehydratase family protein [Candidatus Dojkabacteria bacterium]
MKILVTGGAGFIGSHVVDEVLSRDLSVAVIDDFSTGRRANIAHASAEFELHEKSILDRSSLDKILIGADAAIHLAAIPSVPRSTKDPLVTNDVNVTGTMNVLDAARHAGIRRVVLASSSSVYGDSPTLPKREDMVPNPKSFYAAHKLQLEHYARLSWELYGLETVALRYFNVYGPRQNPNGDYAAVIPKFLTRMLRGERPIIYGDGTTSRDFTYVSDVAKATVDACFAPDAAGKAINIARGEQISLNELVGVMNECLGTSFDPIHEDFRQGDVKHSRADINRAKQLLEYRPDITIGEGMRRVARYLKDE